MRDRPLNRTQPLDAPLTRRQRDRAEASTGSDQTHPSRAGPIPRSPQALAYESHPAYYVGVGGVTHRRGRSRILHICGTDPLSNPFFRTYPEEPTGTQTKHQPKQAISDCRTPLV